MPNKYQLIMFFLFTNCMLFAQNHFLGLSAGLTSAETERETYDYYQSARGFLANANYEFQKKHFIAVSGIGVQQKGFSQSLIYTDTNGVVLGDGAIENVRHLYLHISQTAGVQFGNRVFGQARGGVRASYYFNTTAASDEFALNDGTSISAYSYQLDYLENFDLSLLLEGVFGFQIEDRRVCFIVSYDRGLRLVGYKHEIADPRFRHHNLSFQLGMSSPIKFGN